MFAESNIYIYIYIYVLVSHYAEDCAWDFVERMSTSEASLARLCTPPYVSSHSPAINTLMTLERATSSWNGSTNVTEHDFAQTPQTPTLYKPSPSNPIWFLNDWRYYVFQISDVFARWEVVPSGCEEDIWHTRSLRVTYLGFQDISLWSSDGRLKNSIWKVCVDSRLGIDNNFSRANMPHPFLDHKLSSPLHWPSGWALTEITSHKISSLIF
jgi:hypothetical protein